MSRPKSVPRPIGGRRDDFAPVDLQFFIDRSEVDPVTLCWNWKKAVRSNGYGAMRVARKTHSAHRYVFQMVSGKTLPKSVDVCHECDNRKCVNPAHLFEGTRKVNMKDCADKGRIKVPKLRGEDSPNSKLKAAQVVAIRADARSQRAIARAYGVDRGTIASILTGKTWASI